MPCTTRRTKAAQVFSNSIPFAPGTMYLVMVFWFAADGWFDPTILGSFGEEDFVR